MRNRLPIILFLMLGTILMLLFGCSGTQTPSKDQLNGDPPPAKVELEAPKETLPKEGEPQKPEVQESSGNQAQGHMDSIKKYLELGLSKEQVQNMLGSNYVEVINSMDDSIVWRYDLLTKQEYHFEAIDGLDEADIMGLVNGDIGIQLFIGWDQEQLVKEYSALYKREDGKIYEYRTLYNGAVKEEIIY